MERDKNSQIYISNISSEVRERDLRHKFEKFGEIKSIHLKTGFAFIVLNEKINLGLL